MVFVKAFKLDSEGNYAVELADPSPLYGEAWSCGFSITPSGLAVLIGVLERARAGEPQIEERELAGLEQSQEET